MFSYFSNCNYTIYKVGISHLAQLAQNRQSYVNKRRATKPVRVIPVGKRVVL